MKSYFYHAQINIDYTKNAAFYKDLMTFLGWSLIFETDGEVGQYNGMAGYTSGQNGDLWFVNSTNKESANYDQVGVNHLAIRVEEQGDVDAVIEHLASKGVKPLFNTPRHRPEFAASEKETYYQIIFETPDKIQVEVVYVGPKV